MPRDIRELVELDYVMGLGWIHTHGMEKAGLPELEIRNVPSFFARPAAKLLNDVCDYMIRTGKHVQAGESMANHGANFKFERPEPMEGEREHYAAERLQILDLEPRCGCCEGHPIEAFGM